MICPYCNKEMKIGEIADSLTFHHNMVSPQLYTEENNQIPLTKEKSPISLFTGTKLPCYYCMDCRKIILDIPT